MNALVILENHFFLDKNNEVWCDRIIDYNYLKRYLNVFEKVTVCGRAIEEEDNVKQGNYKLLVTGKDVNFKKLPNFYGIKGLIINYFKMKKMLKKYLKEVDCVIYRAPTPISLFTYNIVLKSKKVLGVEFMFNANKMIEGSNLISKVINKYISFLAKRLCMKANGVSYVTECTLQKIYPCKAITEGESKNYFTASYSTIELEKEEIIPMNWQSNNKPKTFHIIHVGYMDNLRKGQDVLIKAFKKVRDYGYNVTLTLIGDGKKRKYFEQLVEELDLSEYVKFEGLIKDKNIIFSKLRKSHLLVFPTEAEGLPRTIIEAMASGLPCISSPVDGIPELLNEEFLVDCGDVNGYANKIIEILSDWNRMIDISKNNNLVSCKYIKERLEERRNTFYNKIKSLVILINKDVK